MRNILSRSISEHAAAFLKKEYSSRELTLAFLSEIESRDKEINAYITVCAESALALSDKADEVLAKGEPHSLLLGIPFAIKDNICTKGVRTTAASRMLENYIPPYDATVVSRLYKSGAILLGKTGLDEFGMGSTGENSIFGTVKNPHDTSRCAGGSSCGSAASVAANEAVFSIGSDTGGSVRLPASFCGIVGVCPTYGRVSRYGLIAHASSLDRIGVLSRTVCDGAAVLSAISGKDGYDSTCSYDAFAFKLEQKNICSLRVGIIDGLMGDITEPDVRHAVLSAADAFCDMGAVVERVPFENIKDALSAYYIISSAEASSNLARYDGVRFGRRAENCKNIEDVYSISRSEGFGDEVKRRIMLGTYALSSGYSEEYHKRACRLRELLREELIGLFEKYDILLAPSAPCKAFKLFEERENVTDIYAVDICTVPASLAGIPALSLPYGKSNGLPLSVQLMARPFCEDILFFAANMLEEVAKK